MTHYSSGRAFEYKIIHTLEKLGYYPIRTAGSHSQIDIVAFRYGYPPKIIQAKHGYISLPEQERIISKLQSITGYRTCYVLTKDNWKKIIKGW